MKAEYVKTQPLNTINVSKIVTIHYYEFDKNFVFNGEEHDFWEMVYIDKGRVQIQRDEETLVLTQGELIFHKPNEFHSIKAVDSAPNFFVISFVCNSPAMAYFKKYQTQLNKQLSSFISSILSEAEKTYIIPKNDPSLKKLNKKSTVAVGGEQLIKTYLEQLLILLVREITEKGTHSLFPNKSSMEHHLIAKAKEFISECLEENFRVDDLCFTLGYSKSYLSRIFQAQTGNTLAAYAVHVKIEKAKSLIREDNLNFSQISDKLSFDNPQYFSRVFKRITGMTPTEFKLSLNFEH